MSANNILRQEPINHETIVKDTVVHEHIHPVQKEEIQEVIFREREQLEVHQITQNMHETEVRPTLIEQRQLAAEVRAPLVEKSAPVPENIALPTREIDATTRTQVVHAPIVNETVKKTIIEEIQPVLERDVIQPTTVIAEQPIYEKIREAPIVVREVRDVREVGSTLPVSAPVTPFPAVNNPLIPQAAQQPLGVQQPLVQPIGLQQQPLAQPIGLQQQPLAQPIGLQQPLATTAPLVPGFAANNGVYEPALRGYAPAQAGLAPMANLGQPMYSQPMINQPMVNQPLYNPLDRGYTPPHALNHPVAQANENRGLTYNNQGMNQAFPFQHGQTIVQPGLPIQNQGLPIYNQGLPQNIGLAQNAGLAQGYVPQQLPVGLSSYAAEGGPLTSSQSVGQTGLVAGTGLISQKDLQMHNEGLLRTEAPLQYGRI